MAKIISFKQTAAQFRKLSMQQAERGDRLKALLYARKSAEMEGGAAGRIRLADALYESGNFEQAADIFLALYFSGERSKEVYGGLTRCFFDMSRLHSSEFFMTEGVSRGAFGDFDYKRGDGSATDLIPPIVFEYPFRAYSVSAARLIYPIKKMLTRGIASFMTDAAIDDSISKYRCGEILEDAFSVVISVRPDKRNAVKMLEVCNMTLDRDPENIGAIAAKVQAYIALGREDEAFDASEDMRLFDIPTDIVELIKCAFAFAAVDDHEGVADFAEEILTFCEEESAMILCALANINVGDYRRAKELFSYVLRMEPNHPVALYYTSLLDSGKDVPEVGYSLKLPFKEELRRKRSIKKIFEQPLCKEYPDGTGALFTWALGHDFQYAGEVGVEMIRTGLYPEIIRASLMSCAVDLELKRKLLAELLTVNHTYPLDVFIGVPVSIKSNSFDFECSAKAKRAYYEALAALIVYYDGDGEKKLAKNFGQALHMIENDKLYISMDVIAAAVLLHCKFRGINKSDHIAALFGKSVAEIVAAEKILFAAEKADV